MNNKEISGLKRLPFDWLRGIRVGAGRYESYNEIKPEFRYKSEKQGSMLVFFITVVLLRQSLDSEPGFS